LIGKPVPEFSLPPLEGLLNGADQMPGFAASDLAKGEPTLVNVFASWCLECQHEHPLLLALGRTPGIRLYGIDYKDDPEAARRFLGRYENPYARIGADRSGRVAIDFGVYGVPETYVVTGDGTIAYRHVGPLTGEVVKDKILPLLAKPNEKPEG
jgi:cytochrome c biogenesis protein CcmG/thiol:disulfide interchange protein DsbE